MPKTAFRFNGPLHRFVKWEGNEPHIHESDVEEAQTAWREHKSKERKLGGRKKVVHRVERKPEEISKVTEIDGKPIGGMDIEEVENRMREELQKANDLANKAVNAADNKDHKLANKLRRDRELHMGLYESLNSRFFILSAKEKK